MYLSLSCRLGGWGQARSGHQTPFNLYQDLLCIKLVGFCVDQEERGSVRRHHPLGLGEALHYQRVHARHLREYRPGQENNQISSVPDLTLTGHKALSLGYEYE